MICVANLSNQPVAIFSWLLQISISFLNQLEMASFWTCLDVFLLTLAFWFSLMWKRISIHFMNVTLTKIAQIIRQIIQYWKVVPNTTLKYIQTYKKDYFSLDTPTHSHFKLPRGKSFPKDKKYLFRQFSALENEACSCCVSNVHTCKLPW